MSLLSAAVQRVRHSSTTDFSAISRSSLGRGRSMLLFVWLMGIAFSAALGAASYLLWYSSRLQPIERRVEIPQVTPLPWRLVSNRLEFTTQPLPESEPEEDQNDTAEDDAWQAEDEQPSASLAERVQEAFSASKRSPSESPQGESVDERVIPSVDSLPPALLQRIPAQRYAVHNYSQDAHSRFINLNGRDFREGDSIIPGLILVRILQDKSIFRFDDRSFAVKAMNDW